MFQNSFLTRIPYSSYLQQGKKILELILPSDSILLAYIGILKDNKYDTIIFKILNSDLLLLLLLFSSQFRVYLYYLRLMVSEHYISPHKWSIRVYFQFGVTINKGIIRNVRLHNFQINKLFLSYLLCVGGIISLPWFSKEPRTTYRRTTDFMASSLCSQDE